MKCNINGKEYVFNCNIKDDEQIRQSFHQLAEKTYGLNFENWYQNGYWDDNYIPYVLLDNNQVVANVSINIINISWKNKKRSYIQLGTVMTDPNYQRKGLSRWLIEKIIKERKSNCDAIYLFANDSVLDFYPKFGFIKADQFQCKMPISKIPGCIKKLNMTSSQNRNLLLNKYSKSNPFSTLLITQNPGLLMFYCSQFMKDDIYYIEEYDAIIIAEYQDEILLCYDIFCDNNQNMEQILSVAAKDTSKTVLFGFTPKPEFNCKTFLLQEENTTLFVLRDKENLFAENQLMFPLLSHA